jgi:hypothetical protein
MLVVKILLTEIKRRVKNFHKFDANFRTAVVIYWQG